MCTPFSLYYKSQKFFYRFFMKQWLILPFCLLAGIVQADINTRDFALKEGFKQQEEAVLIPIPDALFKNWKYAYGVESEEEKGSVLEWIPEKDEIEDWSELLQVQHFELPKEITVEYFAPLFLDTLKENFPEITSNVLQFSKERVLLEWSLAEETKGQSPQDELVLFLPAKDGLFRIAYTKKVPHLSDQEREEWITILNNTNLDR